MPNDPKHEPGSDAETLNAGGAGVAQCPNGHALQQGETLCPVCGTFVVGFIAPVSAPLPCIPGHELLQELGRGGMGVVYKARHLRLNRIVALKMILAGDFASVELCDRFEREATSIARLQHPNIVQLFEIGEAAGKPYFSVEFVDGSSLADRLRGATLAPKQAAHLVAVLARAIHQAHNQGIVHRDLKPANVLIAGSLDASAEQWNPKIADFGLARHLNETTVHTKTGVIVGTPSYMAPEQASADTGRIGPATDVYALGAILYELLTGRPPFVAPTPFDTLSQVLHTEPVPVRHLQQSVPRDLEVICLKCLHKASARRYASAIELAEDLQRFLNGKPIIGRPTSAPERVAKWVRRRPAVAALWASATLLVVGAIVAAIMYDRRFREIQAQGLVHALPEVETSVLPRLAGDLAEYRVWTEPLLRRMLRESPVNSKQRLHASLALLSSDPEQADYLTAQIFVVDYSALPVIRTFLSSEQARVTPPLWQTVLDHESSDDKRLRAACVLAYYTPRDARWRDIAPLLVEPLLAAVRTNLVNYSPLAQCLAPMKEELQQPLLAVYRDGDRGEIDRSFATTFLADFRADDEAAVAELFLDGDDKQMTILIPRLIGASASSKKVWRAALHDKNTDGDQNRAAMRRANAACGLLRLVPNADVWALFRHEHDPSARSFLIQRLHSTGVDPALLIAHGKAEQDLSARRGLLLALGTFPFDALSESDRKSAANWITDLFFADGDPGTHAAAEWVLRRWHHEEAVHQAQRRWASAHAKTVPASVSSWYVNGQGQTMVVLPGPITFMMGSPTSDPEREGGVKSKAEWQHQKTIPRSYAIAATEVTREQFLRFRPKFDNYREDISPTARCPINRVSWYDAAAYCNWLSKQEGVLENEWCYVPNAEGKFDDGMTMRPSYLSLSGYRLPTEAEWEYACRAGATTSRPFGSSRRLLSGNAWYTKNSLDRFMQPVGTMPPNDFGLFDMLGNAMEWCQNRSIRYEAGADAEDMQPILSKESRILRGASFNDHPQYVRSTHRFPFQPSIIDHSMGVRVVRTVPMKQLP